MKREILCTKCAEQREKTHGDGSQYIGEHIKYVHGTTKMNPYVDGGVTLCDGCVEETPMPVGTPCVAVSTWADGMRYPYQPWESEFITITEEES